MKLLIILFLIRLYARITEEKYGCTGIKVAKSIEIYCTKLSKIKCGIDFLLTCKRNNLTPTFPRTKLAVKVSFQLRNKISRQIIDAELKNKHRKKKILLNKIKKRQEELKSRVGYVTYVVFYHNINKVISKKRTDWMKTHHKKIENLKRTQNKINNIRNRPTENIIHNFSSYALSEEEKRALSFSLDENIPTKLNENKIQTEFESFYWQLLQHTKHLSQQEQDQLKSKIRRTFGNYARTKTPYKYKKIIENLCNNKNIIILKQDKGCSLVALNCKSYVKKCCKILETGQFR